MDYRAITDVTSLQYQYIHSDNITIGENGLLYNGEYIGVALGSRFGKIGDKFIVTLDTGKKIKVVKIESKADKDVYNNCHHKNDGSVVEFVIDRDKFALHYSMADTMGDANYIDEFNGSVVKIQKVVEN